MSNQYKGERSKGKLSMGTLLGRAVSVVVCRMQVAMAAACSCTTGKMSNGPEAVIEKTSSGDNNAGQQKAMIIPDIHIDHVSRSCHGSTRFLHGDEMSLITTERTQVNMYPGFCIIEHQAN